MMNNRQQCMNNYSCKFFISHHSLLIYMQRNGFLVGLMMGGAHLLRQRYVQLLVGIGIVGYLSYILFRQTASLPDLLRQLRQQRGSGWWAVLLILFVPVNQLIEAKKWQVLLQHIAPISLGSALRSVLAGLSLGLAVPGGDMAGRVLLLRQPTDSIARTTGMVGATLLSGGLQYYVAILLGALGWAEQWLTLPERQSAGETGILWLLLALILSGVVLVLLRHRLTGWVHQLAQRWPRVGRWVSWLAVATDPPGHVLASGFGLAVARHLVFSVQFYASLRLFGVDIQLVAALGGIWVVYMAKTITPSLNLVGDLGVREMAALWAFGPFHPSIPALVAATLTLWLVNIATPVLIGLVGLWPLRNKQLTT